MKLIYRCKLVVLLLLFVFKGRAQGVSHITGSVQDPGRQALAAVSVSLLSPADSAVLYQTTGNKEGVFRFTAVSPGAYLLSVSAVGYRPHLQPLAAHQPVVQLAPVVLVPAAKDLSGVTVQAARSLVERKIDRTVVNVDALVSGAGSSALELLERTPGVAVDENGAVSLNGKAGVLVLIDDKPTYLSGEALANYLRSLPSSSLDKIELMPTPPARYDAAGTGGVINIKTKRTKAAGFNGNLSVALSQGRLFSTTNSLNLNYKAGRVAVFGNFSYIRQNAFTDLDIHRTYRDEQGATSSFFTQHSYIRRRNQAYSGKAGLDYTVHPRTTVGVALSTLHRPMRYDIENTSRILNARRVEDSATVAHSHERIRWDNQGVNLNARHDLRGGVGALTVDLDYIRYHSPSEQAYYNTTYRAQGGAPSSDLLTGHLPSTINIYASKADYSRTIQKSLVVEAGIKSSYIQTQNIAEYFLTANGSTHPDYEKTNHFRYKEQISAAYLNVNRDGRRFSFKAGLRAEHTVSRGHQLGNAVKQDSSFKNPYTDLFPTVFLSYKIDTLSVHQVNLSYGRRIDRPVYQDLNPFVTPLDKFTVYAGNPYLRPSFTNEVSLAYTYKNKVTATLSYSDTRDVTMEAIKLDGNNYLSQPANVGSNRILGLSVNAGLRPAKWWTVNVHAEVQDRHYEGALFHTRLDTSALYFGTNFSNQLRLGKAWSAEIGGFYRTGVLVGQVSLASLWQLNAGVQRKVWKDRGTVRVAVRDIFYSGVRNGIIHNLYRADATFRNKGDLRVYTLSFALSFGKLQQNERARTRGSAQNEQSRVREG